MPGGSVWVVVVAGGEGRRFGGQKQFAQLGGRRVLDWALRAAEAVADGVVLVLPSSRAAVAPLGSSVGSGTSGRDAKRASCPVLVVGGGATRSASVRSGLAAVPLEAEVVVVHDAARPLASASLFESVVAAVRAGADGAICAIPVTDTVKRIGPQGSLITLERSELLAVQTPQAFAAGVLRRAHDGEPEATDDAALLEALGARVVVVAGEATNTKLTSPLDLVVLESVLERSATGADASGTAPQEPCR